MSVKSGPVHARRLSIGAEPTRPSTLYLDAVAAATERRAAHAPAIVSPHSGAPDAMAQAIRSATDELDAELRELSTAIFGFAEEGFEERRSVAAIAALLDEHGIPSRVGGWGLETSLLAGLIDGRPATVDDLLSPSASASASASGQHSPTVAILAEYDALPGVGHACGHNIIAASAAGAFLALARAAESLPAGALPGRILLLGTPAEEGGNGKELMARAGAFEGVDAAIMVHPFGYDVADQPFIGRRIVRVRYHGVAAHASATPFQGRNALDAATLNYQAVGLLRQHLYPGDRIHGVIVNGGQRPNVVPEEAELEYYVRSERADTLRELSDRVDDIANGIALATGTGVEVEWDPQPFSLPIRHNAPLAARWAERQAERGRKVLSSESVPSHLAASTDFGNVSVRVPGIHPVIAISPPDVSLHTREFAEYAASEAGHCALADAAYGLAAVTADYLLDGALRDAVAADFTEAGGQLDVEGYFL